MWGSSFSISSFIQDCSVHSLVFVDFEGIKSPTAESRMEQLINFIIRPPRAEYNPNEDLLDPTFKLKGKLYQRNDLEIVNDRADVLQCSHYVPIAHPEEKPLPCVIYCHGNSGCRMDASEAAVILLPLSITVFTLDFSGSGLSGGEHVTLGWNEKSDLRAVVHYLREDGKVSLIGLWGRSMGAVTSLMYAAEDPSIAGMVLDSPFSDLIDLMMEMVDNYKVRLPRFTVKFLIQYIRRAIQKKAKFDIMDLNTVKAAKSCFVPVLFGHASEDNFIRPCHSEIIFEAYVEEDKNIIRFKGDHNSPRPQFYFDSISIFFNNVLQPPPQEFGSLFFSIYPRRWGTLQDLVEDSDDLQESSSEGAATVESSIDAIEELRSKKPADSSPSSSGFSFESAKDSPFEDKALCPLSSLMGFPTNVEEEEQMIMEAVVESLKDLKNESTSNGTSDLLKLPTDRQYDSSSSGASHSREDESTTDLAASKTNKASQSTAASEPEDEPIADGMTCCWDFNFRNR